MQAAIEFHFFNAEAISFTRFIRWITICLFFLCSLFTSLAAQQPETVKKAVRDTQFSVKAGGSFSLKSEYFTYAESYYGTEGSLSSVAFGADFYDGESSLQFGFSASWFKSYISAMKVGSLLPVAVSGNLTASQWVLPVLVQTRYFFLGNLYAGAGAGFALTRLDFKVTGTANPAYDTTRSESRLVPVINVKLGDEFILTEKIFLAFQAELFYSFSKYDVAGTEKSLSTLHFMPSVSVGYYF